MDNKHTDLPWQTSHRKNGLGMYSTDIYAEDGRTIATLDWCALPTTADGVTGSNRTENAEFIVRACNAHDDLVKALQEMITETEMHRDSPILRSAKAALAKAKA